MRVQKIITHPDLDGLVSAAILSLECGLSSSEIDFAQPWEVSKIDLGAQTGVAVLDLPYVPGASVWFDHHANNDLDSQPTVEGLRKVAKSCASNIVERLYGLSGDEFVRWTSTDTHNKLMLEETNSIDSGDYSQGDLTNPEGYTLLANVIDNNQEPDFLRYVVNLLKEQSAYTILEDSVVKQRVDIYKTNLTKVTEYMRKKIKVEENVTIVDMRDADDQVLLSGAYKMLQYGLDPDANVSVRIYHPDLDPSQVRFQIGHSVINRTCETDIGAFLKREFDEYSAGGHKGAGGVTVPSDQADRVYKTIMRELKKD